MRELALANLISAVMIVALVLVINAPGLAAIINIDEILSPTR